MLTAHPIGTEVVYCDEGNERRAQVTEHHPETGEVHGLAIYGSDGRIEFGVTGPTPATAPQHRITHGHFWKRA